MRASVVLLSLPLLLVPGCARLQVWLGWRARLDKVQVVSLACRFPKGQSIAPGESLPLVVELTEPDGTRLLSEGEGKGKVRWEELRVEASVVEVGRRGRLTLPADPRLSDGRTPHVVVTVPSHPGLRAEADLQIRYDQAFVATFSGSAGASGLDGLSGSDGMSGAMGSFDSDNPSPGGNGSDGGTGSDGSDGGAGGDAPPVLVQVALRPGPRPLLQVRAEGGQVVKYFLVDPLGGTLQIKAEGGPGGSGGRGGRGGRGGSGGLGSPNGLSGSDGRSGLDGQDGPPGRPGPITVTYDPAARPYLSAIQAIYREGGRRPGPRPVFQEAPVAALW
ncbi:hypothetical protein [Geothrix paludis]|uniref:hypothetical protein n=1 Tax=Geothrix paludis TaxID=2922722 RepID=UPI001FACF4CB|nr:hypothetical protein [Geothrix paludis]